MEVSVVWHPLGDAFRMDDRTVKLGDMGDQATPETTPRGIQTPWTVIGNIYQRWLPPIVATGTILWLSFVLLFHPWRPPVGVYIACVAGLAVVVTIWPPESRWSKAAWLLVFFACTGLEIVTLYQERSENQAQQAQTRKDEEIRFAGILQQSQKQFEATMAKTGKVLDKTQKVAELAEENLSNLTGRNSVAYIAPQPPDTDGKVPLGIVNAGRYPLTGVTVVVMDVTTWPFKTQPPLIVGTLASHVVRRLNLSVDPVVGTNPPGVASFWIFIYAQNGTSSQMLQFRKGKKVLWDYRSSLNREVPSKTSMIPLHPRPTSDVGISFTYGWIEDRDSDPKRQAR